MEIRSLASGSTGNCYHISDEKSSVLIECGIPIKKIRQGCGFKLSAVSGCLCSHFHGDHCKSISKVIESGVEVFCSIETATFTGIGGHRVKIVKHGDQFETGSFKIVAFGVEHDVPGALGFLIASGSGKLLFCTDTHFIRPRFTALNYIMIECNYSEKILTENVEAGRMDIIAANRLLKSHMSLENLLNFFKATDLKSVQEIHLIHISKRNGDPEMFTEAIQSATGKMVIAHG